MGCFISTSSAPPPQPKTHRISTSAASAQHNAGSKSPPPVVYEETVKRVLSEAPATAKRPTPPVSTFHGSQRMLHQNGGDARNSAASSSNDDPSSDVDSEIHSTFSESFSTGNDGALRWRPMLSGRSFPGELKREKTAGRSPARRSGASPGRVKPGSGYSSKAGGRDSPRSSGSGSSKKGLAAGKSTRKAGNYTGRVGCGSGERIRTGDEEEREPPTNNELLESSLVSLECFIFL